MIENEKKIIELEIKSSKYGIFLTKYGIISIITININIKLILYRFKRTSNQCHGQF